MFKQVNTSFFTLWCLFSITSLTLGINVCLYNKQETYKAIENAIVDLVEDGTFFIEEYTFAITHPAIRLNATITNTTINQLNEYNLETMNWIDILKEKFQIFKLTLFNVSLVGNYDGYGNVGELFDIYGKGPFWINLHNLTVTLTGSTAKVNQSGICFPIDMNVTADKVENYLYNFMEDDELELLMNHAITSIGGKAVGIAWKDVAEMNGQRWENWINNLINQITHQFRED